ncbi:MAG: LysR family transcriptional regulator [Eggerthellaceae bacterium]|nr:LysR family transcriptional regulator [Eggerthellaceae bacterium]
MALDDWDWFITLAEQESFTKASERLQMSQQTLSARLNALEKSLDVKLVTRSNPLTLTPAGMVFLLYAREQRQAQQDMMRQIGEVTGSGVGVLKIAISHLRSRTIMPFVVKRIREQLPKVQVKLIEGTNRELLRMAEHAEVDAVIARFEDIHPGVELFPVYQEEIVLALHKDVLEQVCGMPAEEAKQKVASQGIAVLGDCPFVLGTLDDIAGRIAYSVLRNAGIKPSIVATSENMGTLLGMAQEGLGAVFCPANILNAAFGIDDSLIQIPLSEQTKYTISLGIPLKNEQWNAIEVLKSVLLEYSRQ